VGNVQFQHKNCFKEVTGFLKISMSLHTRFAAVTHRAVGELLHVAVNREEFLTLREEIIIIIMIIIIVIIMKLGAGTSVRKYFD
jgi:uncharacterized membrane protein AbrB (regulator of aidB expression)